jgi:hypothetical protein
MGRGILFALLYGIVTWIAVGIVVSLMIPLIAEGNAQQMGKNASLPSLLLAVAFAVYGYQKYRR